MCNHLFHDAALPDVKASLHQWPQKLLTSSLDPDSYSRNMEFLQGEPPSCTSLTDFLEILSKAASSNFELISRDLVLRASWTMQRLVLVDIHETCKKQNIKLFMKHKTSEVPEGRMQNSKNIAISGILFSQFTISHCFTVRKNCLEVT